MYFLFCDVFPVPVGVRWDLRDPAEGLLRGVQGDGAGGPGRGRGVPPAEGQAADLGPPQSTAC